MQLLNSPEVKVQWQLSRLGGMKARFSLYNDRKKL